MSNEQYRWKNPHEWLSHKLQESSDINDIRSIAALLMQRADNDTMQDLFQNEMDQDGYFEPIKSDRGERT